jgi:hypothetical protein
MPRQPLNLVVTAGLAALLCAPSIAGAQTAPSLGTATGFAVLGATTVTNTGSTVINGNVGVSPGSAITGFPPGTITGTFHGGDATALQAQNDVTTAFNSLGSQSCTQDLTGQNLGGLTLTPGVYCFSSSAQLTGTLTLNALGNPNAVFIFRTGSTLTTASGSSVALINSGQNCNVFWQIGSSATLGTATTFIGNILAQASITLTTGARVAGRTLARTGAVTLDSNTIERSLCAGVTPPPPAPCPTVTLSPATLPPGTAGVAYTQTITGSGGTAPYTFTLIAGSLPPSLTLTASGVLSGTPTAAGSSTFTVRATDLNGCFADRAYTVVIAAGTTCPTITLTPATLPNATVGVFNTVTITGSGGTGPYVFGVTSGALPLGVTLTPAGVLSGTPTTAGTSTFTIRGTDANGCFRELTYTVITAVAVPTLAQWAMVALGILLGLAGFLAIRRRGGANAIL